MAFLGREDPGDYVSQGLAQLLETPAKVQDFIAEINRAIRVASANPGRLAQFRNDLFELKQLLSNQAALGPDGTAAALLDAAATEAAIDARINVGAPAAITTAKERRKVAKAAQIALDIGARPLHMICTYEEVIAKYNATKFAGLTPNELVRLFSPPESLYDFDLTTQEGYDAWFAGLTSVPTRAYNLSLDSQAPDVRRANANAACTVAQQGIAQQVANRKIADIINNTSGYLQTAIPKISFYNIINGAAPPTLTYGVCGAHEAPAAGDTCSRLGFDLANFNAIKSRLSSVRTFNDRGTATSKGWQTVLNVMTLEDIKPFLKPGWRMHGAPGHAFDTTDHKTNFVVYKWLPPGGATATQASCPIEIKSKSNIILGDSGSFNIFVRYPDMALVYVNSTLNAGQINPPPPAGIYIDDSNKAAILTRNRYFRDNFNPLIAAPAAPIFAITGGNQTLPMGAAAAGISPAINYQYNAPLDTGNCFTDGFQGKIKLAVRALFYQYIITTGLPDSFNVGGALNRRRTKNKRMNQRQRRSKSKSKSMSMFKSAKRTFYRMNKRNKTLKNN